MTLDGNKRLWLKKYSQDETIEQYKRTGIYQWSLLEEEVILILTKVEAQVFDGVKCHPVALSLVFDNDGQIQMHNSQILHKKTYIQVNKSSHLQKWIHYET